MTTEKASRFTAFDIRLVIALLLGVYGVVLTVLGIGFMTDEEIEKSAGVNINLWAGIGMIAVAAAFALWTVVRPLRVPEQQDEQQDEPTGS